jgi:hypothetical protein
VQIFKKCIFAAALSVECCVAASLCSAETPQGQACRVVAGYIADGGVSFDKLDAASAIMACEQALAETPGDPYILAFYSRALNKLGRYADALRSARVSADAGNRVGLRVLGYLYRMGQA